MPFMFREKEARVSFHDRMARILCRSYAGSHNCCEFECNFCATPRRQHPHLTRPFLQLLHFFFHKIPQVLVRKGDTHVPFMAWHLKITYLSADSSYRFRSLGLICDHCKQKRASLTEADNTTIYGQGHSYLEGTLTPPSCPFTKMATTTSLLGPVVLPKHELWPGLQYQSWASNPT